MLNVVDEFSKYAWSIPMKDKTGITTLNAFKQIVENSKRKPKHIWLDLGKEFYNMYIHLWIKDNNIIRYSTYGEHKSAVVERFNRTLKTNMWKMFTAENTRNWINLLDKLLNEYNNKLHSTIKMRPVEASKEKTKFEVLENQSYLESNKEKPKFTVGDRV